MLTPKKYALPLFLLLLGGLLLWWYNQANPHIDPLPGDAEYGYQLISKTADNYGPGGRINIRSNGMNCSNCHLEAGKISMPSRLPVYTSNTPVSVNAVAQQNRCINGSAIALNAACKVVHPTATVVNLGLLRLTLNGSVSNQ